MTITTVYRNGHPVAIDLDTTVGINLPQPDPSLAHTVRITPPFRRPNAVGETRIRIPRTIGIVDEPLATDALPPYAAYANRQRQHIARHRPKRRTWRTVLAATLCRLAAAITSGGTR